MGFFESEKELQGEEQEFNLRTALKGMSEKQLLKVLVLLTWEKYHNDSDSHLYYDELIAIAKER